MSMGIQPTELIGGYCDLEKMKTALAAGDLAAVRGEIDKAMRGFLDEKPDDETLSLLVNCLFVVLQYDVFYDFLSRSGLSLGDTHTARAELCADWDAWQQGNTLPDERLRLFRAIAALHLSADDFDEIPAPDMKEPKRQRKTYGDFELVTIADAEITDDGGLYSCPDPLGKSFVLQDADGVTYYLENVRRAELPENFSLEEGRLYTADGWIDGYTGKQKREIEFEVYDGGVIFTYTTDGVDDSEAEQDPRWQPYENWVQQRITKRRKQQAAFLAQYL